MPDSYGRLLRATLDKNLPIQAAEMEIFGATHEQIGAYLVGLWGLPDTIAEAVAFHHVPLQCPDREFGTVGVVHVADALAHGVVGSGGDGEDARLSKAYLDQLTLGDRLTHWTALAQDPGV
jgi:HD-like signal output (HDOD) protein